jgi:hypothetical protein
MHVLIFIKLPIERFNESIISINHNEYPIQFKTIQCIRFDKQITMDIQMKSKDSMYPLDETH